jgi:hypothetical protein
MAHTPEEPNERSHMSEEKEQQKILAEKISEVLRENALLTDDGPAVLLGWVAIVEWKAPNNERWLSLTGADVLGEEPPEWQTQGYLYNALFDDWDRGEDDDS